MAGERIILGTRGSDLALAQTRAVESALRQSCDGLEVAVEIIRTSGDEIAGRVPPAPGKAGRKGMFTREIEKELIAGRIDVAVHSAKDLQSEPADHLEIRATLARANTDDVLITKNGVGLTTLPKGSTIATGSIRRQRQLAWQRPDLRIAELRGNVPTRLRKLRENEQWSGIILARAGLERLGIAFDGEILSQEFFLPAGGQGVIALQVRRDDERVQRIADLLDDKPTHLSLRAEREFLRLVGGDCNCPVGVQARIENGALILRAQIFENERTEPKTGKVIAKLDDTDPELIARALFSQMYG